MNKLHIGVQPAAAALERFGKNLQAVMQGCTPRSYSGIGFENMAQFGEVFSPKRWELVESLKLSGPLTIASHRVLGGQLRFLNHQ